MVNLTQFSSYTRARNVGTSFNLVVIEADATPKLLMLHTYILFPNYFDLKLYVP